MKAKIKMCLTAFTVAFFAFQAANAQNVPTDVKKKLVGKWVMEYMEYDGKKETYSAEQTKDSWTLYKADGTFEMKEMGEKFPGTWSYDAKTQTLTTIDTGTGLPEGFDEELSKESGEELDEDLGKELSEENKEAEPIVYKILSITNEKMVHSITEGGQETITGMKKVK